MRIKAISRRFLSVKIKYDRPFLILILIIVVVVMISVAVVSVFVVYAVVLHRRVIVIQFANNARLKINEKVLMQL
jgi:hypothetical protein